MIYVLLLVQVASPVGSSFLAPVITSPPRTVTRTCAGIRIQTDGQKDNARIEVFADPPEPPSPPQFHPKNLRALSYAHPRGLPPPGVVSWWNLKNRGACPEVALTGPQRVTESPLRVQVGALGAKSHTWTQRVTHALSGWTVGQTVGQNAPVDGESNLLLPLVSLKRSMAEVPVTGGELPCGGTIKISMRST